MGVGSAVIWFGKHRGRRWSEVVREDPDYINWVISTLDGTARDAAVAAVERAADTLLWEDRAKVSEDASFLDHILSAPAA